MADEEVKGLLVNAANSILPILLVMVTASYCARLRALEIINSRHQAD
jgi:hypothetical protein